MKGYGLSESTGPVSWSNGPGEIRRWGSAGKLTPSCEAKIVDPDTSYAGDPGATSATLEPNGWLRTGDLCYIDKGYQVAPAELEQWLQSHPEIADAAVIPYPDEEAGQVPLVFLVKQPQSSIDERGIMDFVSKQVFLISMLVTIFPFELTVWHHRSQKFCRYRSQIFSEREGDDASPKPQHHLQLNGAIICRLLRFCVHEYHRVTEDLQISFVCLWSNLFMLIKSSILPVLKILIHKNALLTYFAQEQVAPYKKIRRAAFVSSIPRSPAGKILRRDLRNMAFPALPPSKM
ncbi:hypothetical protein D5086_002948 [Populus alba]|uniref:Uncharacterized protein n=1 Tax=Populus alba TaxID=43335 RepID=A0ACC4D454_POPAL